MAQPNPLFKKRNSFRKRLLRKQTPAELKFAEEMKGFRFKLEPQRILIGKSEKVYFTDFWLPHYAIAVEIDGGIHKERIDYDIERELDIYSGPNHSMVTIIRFTNEQILDRSYVPVLYEMVKTKTKYLNCFPQGRTMLNKEDKRLETLKEKYSKYYRVADLPIQYGGNNILDWWDDNLDGFDMKETEVISTYGHKSSRRTSYNTPNASRSRYASSGANNTKCLCCRDK